jgi:hypothetical protein
MGQRHRFRRIEISQFSFLPIAGNAQTGGIHPAVSAENESPILIPVCPTCLFDWCDTSASVGQYKELLRIVQTVDRANELNGSLPVSIEFLTNFGLFSVIPLRMPVILNFPFLLSFPTITLQSVRENGIILAVARGQ